jgi:prepilin-type N-terminal cleavage/methylation domain-containing protein
MLYKRQQSGFTLAELLTALMVGSIILVAAVTLTDAYASAREQTSELGKNQAVLRYAHARLNDLIHCSNRLESASAAQLDFWTDINGDGGITSNERFSIKAGAGDDSIVYETSGETVTIVPECSNIRFVLDQATPDTRLVGIMFDIEVENGTREYQILASLWGTTGHVP